MLNILLIRGFPVLEFIATRYNRYGIWKRTNTYTIIPARLYCQALSKRILLMLIKLLVNPQPGQFTWKRLLNAHMPGNVTPLRETAHPSSTYKMRDNSKTERHNTKKYTLLLLSITFSIYIIKYGNQKICYKNQRPYHPPIVASNITAWPTVSTIPSQNATVDLFFSSVY